MIIIISINTTWNIYNFRKGILEALLSKGYEVIALATTDVFTANLEAMGVKCISIKINPKGINPFADIYLIRNYYSVFKRHKPDVILSYTIKPNIYGNIAAGLLKIPVINNISGLGTIFIKSNLLTLIGKRLYKRALRYSNHVFFQNNDDRHFFLDAKLMEVSKSSVIPGSGVDTNKFKSKKTKNSGKQFLFVGRLLRDKGIIEYLEAAMMLLKEHPFLEFLIVGEIDSKNKTAISKSELDFYLKQSPQIKYLGNSNNIIEVLNGIDVMVLPSYREGLSKSLLEAAAMSIPIVTTNVSGCKEVVIDNYNGFLCAPRNTDSLLGAMIKMTKLKPSDRHQMGLNGRDLVVKKFKEEFVVSEYLSKINQIITNKIIYYET